MRRFKHDVNNGIILVSFMPISIVTSALGILVFLFIFWKRLREDFAPSIIFSISFYILLGVLTGWLISLKFFPNWFLYTSFGGALAGLYVGILQYKIRFYESLEAVVIAFLPWLSFVFLKDSAVNQTLSSFIAFLVILIFIYVFYYLDTHFREFTWYRSGKVGFAGLATLGFLLLARSATSFVRVSVISFNGKFDALASASLGFICFILLYNLSRKIE